MDGLVKDKKPDHACDNEMPLWKVSVTFFFDQREIGNFHFMMILKSQEV